MIKGRLFSPVRWLGGKTRFAPKLAEMIPVHRRYVEVFGGGGALLFFKGPSHEEVYNDLDPRLANLFRVIKDPASSAELAFLASLTPYAREEFDACHAADEAGGVGVEAARAFLAVTRMCFGASGSGFGTVVTGSTHGAAATADQWIEAAENVPLYRDRLSRVEITNDHFRDCVARWDSEGTFFYLDPPYVPETRDQGTGYKHEMTTGEHDELVRILLGIKGCAVLSGYRSDVYAPLEEAGWTRRGWKTVCMVAGRTSKSGLKGAGAATSQVPREECVWISPATKSAGQGSLF